VIEHAVRCAYLAGTEDEGLIYLDNRLRNRRSTYIEWEKELLGPIKDTQGVEQGGCPSDRIYRLTNNEQLDTAQKSQLGVDLGLSLAPSGALLRQVLSAVGQADDVGLVSSDLKKLKLLLFLTKLYCQKFQVKLVGAKTKLLVFTTKHNSMQAMVDLAINNIEIDGHNVVPSLQASHVGVVRCPEGSSPHIADRLSAHRKAVYSVMHAGLARGHRANTAAALRVEAVYGISVLLSGLASLILTSKDEKLLDQYYKVHLQRLLKLHQATPAPVVFFLAGCLPLPAKLHLRMFSLFGQICRLRAGDNILAIQARNIFSSSCSSSKSWFWRLRQLCLQYSLPHPYEWLDNQPSKLQVKTMARSAVLQFWLAKLRSQADHLSSLKYLQTNFLGLTTCHPMFRLCGSSPREVEKASCQARLLSGRYRVEALSGHWTPWNKEGLCTLPECWGTEHAHAGTVESLLTSCYSLSLTRVAVMKHTMQAIMGDNVLETLVQQCLRYDTVQFWLDCTTMVMVISAVQQHGQGLLSTLLRLTRNYCFMIHKARNDMLGEQ
jgi:hypothetical protein